LDGDGAHPGTLLGAGFTSVISIVRLPRAKPSAAAQTDSGAAAAVSRRPLRVSASPLAKAIEVTGFASRPTR